MNQKPDLHRLIEPPDDDGWARAWTKGTPARRDLVAAGPHNKAARVTRVGKPWGRGLGWRVKIKELPPPDAPDAPTG